MFRGINTSQLRWLLSLVAAIVAGVYLGQLRSSSTSTSSLTMVGAPQAPAAGATAAAPSPYHAPASPTPDSPWPLPSSAMAPDAVVPSGQIDLNTADEAALDLLPGVGPSKAKAIIADRQQNGPFRRPEDLDRVKGFGPATVAKLLPLISVGDELESPTLQAAATPSGLLRINVASAAELESLEMVGPTIARRIVEDRDQRGPFRRPEDLLRVQGIGPRFLELNRHRLRFD